MSPNKRQQVWRHGGRRSCIKENIVRRLRLSFLKTENRLEELYGADGTPINIFDFLETNEAKINFSRKGVFLNNLFAAEICDNSEASVETISSLIIPSLSEALIRTKISDHYKWQTSIIEPAVNLSNKRIAPARCIVSPKSAMVM